LGLQLGHHDDTFGVALGYLGTLEPSTDGSGFDHFFDLVATINADALSVVLNGDYTITDNGDADSTSFFGVSLGLGYAISDSFGLAARYEFLSDSDNTLYGVAGAEDVTLQTITGTFDIKPAASENFVLRWDNRIEMSSEDIFVNKDSEGTDKWFTSVLGVVVHPD
jgi:hypothetical protein